MFTATRERDQGYEVVKLAGAGHEVRILPANGFNLYAWTYEGGEILMKPADINAFGSKYGIPVLFPTPNRVKNGQYTWQGRTYTMKKRGEKVVRHGLVMDELFTVTELCADEKKARCSAQIVLTPDSGVFEGYPFPCTLRITYTLTSEGVRMDARITNDGADMMPFGFAVHPYFSKRGDANRCFIKVPVRRYYETDENLIPTGRILPAGEGTTVYDDFHSVESLYLDTVFRGMSEDSDAQVRYDDVTLHIRASDCFRNAVIFTPHNREGFCIEPQTCATNFINLHAQGFVDESGLLTLAAGQSFACWVDYTVKKL